MSRVRWHELRHAYGSAAGVPGMLARIARGDAGTSEVALSDLAPWIGELAVFDATVAAVPFLWELAVTDTVACRTGVIELLQAVLEHANPPQAEVQLQAHRTVLLGRLTADLPTRDADPAVRTAAQGLLDAIDHHRCGTCRPA
ncbi:hypothetical protein [Streptomyces sp. NPDC048473]|uniref:hypothetical protein n=1 Tax=unclassified Streptomyces TaxID=2593676 RepID=UPI0037114430